MNTIFDLLLLGLVVNLHVRTSKQEKKMSDINADLTTLTTAEAALETHITSQDAEIQALKNSIQPGVTLTDDQVAAFHALAEKSALFVAGFTPVEGA